MRTIILDTNVVLRFLLADHPKHSPKSKQLFELAEAGSIRLYLSEIIVAELVWTMDSFFEFSRDRIATILRGLLLHDGVVMDEKETLLVALERFAEVNVDFADCHAAALSLKRNQIVASYDKDFKKFKDIDWKTPDQVLDGTD